MIDEMSSGIRDSCNYIGALGVLARCRKSHRPLFLSIWLTGFVFLGSLVLYSYGIDPLLRENPALNKIFTAFYYLLWVFPIYLICSILNIFSYSDISLDVYQAVKGKVKSPALSISRALAYEVHRAFIIVVYLVMVLVISLIPYTGVINLVLLSWLYSFYCFEYKWMLEGKTINKKIHILESNAFYYLGFGLPFTFFTYWFPGFIGGGVWALLFPMFMVTAILSKPPQKPLGRIHIFKKINSFCSKVEVLLLGGKKA